MIDPNGDDGQLEGVRRPERTSKTAGIVISVRSTIVYLLVVVIVLVAVALCVHFFGANCDPESDSPDLDGGPSIAPPPTQGPSTLVTDVRLPRDVHPVHYEIRLLPWIEEGNFSVSGRTNILVETGANSSTRRIVLHSVDITISRSTVRVNEMNSLLPF